MSNSFAIVIDSKIKFENLIDSAVKYFKTELLEITKKNAVLTQKEDGFILDLTPTLINCIVFSGNNSEKIKEIKEFFKGHDKNNSVFVYKYNN